MEAFKRYIPIIFTSYLLVVLLMALEVFYILKYHHTGQLFIHEAIGLAGDFFLVNILLLLGFLIYYLLYRLHYKLANAAFISVLLLVTTAHVLIIKYYVYQLVPLDAFLFQYSFREVLHTLNTSDTNFLILSLILLFLIALALVAYKVISGIRFSGRMVFAMIIALVISLPVNLLISRQTNVFSNNFSMNKSAYFFNKCLDYATRDKDPISFNSSNIARSYQEAFPELDYINEEHPFLHKPVNRDVLGKYFSSAETAPNLVVLIIEGLSGDFMQPVKGVDFMPFLRHLAGKSLYWDRFLTTGERSFAAVPSILGGLPYGEKGFMLAKRIPYHFSLLNVLKTNAYHTSFFYGQGAWFHRKDNFFRLNNTDLIFDNSCFSSKYNKIITGNDDFFWGYNDKDLFSQSFEVLDTLPPQKRLDVYFTGTSHSPFVIADEAHYNALFNKMIDKTSPDHKVFFKKYRKYFLTLLFVNDALEDFFNEYKTRSEYDNTLFVITGDHPMTEIPIENSLKRYHVPLILFSPLLKESRTFHGIGSHLDIYQSMLSFLSANYNIDVPPASASLGGLLDTCRGFCSDKSIPLMNDNREVADFYSNGYFISNSDDLFRIDSGFNLTKIENDSLFEEISTKLAAFKAANRSAFHSNELMPDSTFFENTGRQAYYHSTKPGTIEFSGEYQNTIERTAVENKPFYYDVSFDLSETSAHAVEGVYQLSNHNDSVVFWRSFELPKQEKQVQHHIRIDSQQVDDSVLFFQAFFWNKGKGKAGCSNLKTAIYR